MSPTTRAGRKAREHQLTLMDPFMSSRMATSRERLVTSLKIARVAFLARRRRCVRIQNSGVRGGCECGCKRSRPLIEERFDCASRPLRTLGQRGGAVGRRETAQAACRVWGGCGCFGPVPAPAVAAAVAAAVGLLLRGPPTCMGGGTGQR